MQLVGIESMPKRNFQIFPPNFYSHKTLVNGEETKLLHVELNFHSILSCSGVMTGSQQDNDYTRRGERDTIATTCSSGAGDGRSVN